MMPLAAKGVIIVGGVIVAAGVALYEHEPFRIWVDDTWKRTSAALQDFTDGLGPDGRRRRREAPHGSRPDWNRQHRERDSRDNTRQRDFEGQVWRGDNRSGTSQRKRDHSWQRDDERRAEIERIHLETLRSQDGLRQRPGHGQTSDPFADPHPQPETARQMQPSLSQDAVKSKGVEKSAETPATLAAPGAAGAAQDQASQTGILTPSSHGSLTPYTPGTPAPKSPFETDTQGSHEYFDAVSNNSANQHDMEASESAPHTESSSALTAESLRAQDQAGEEGLDIISAPTSAFGGRRSEIDMEALSDAPTETMSHVSRDEDLHEELGGNLGPGDADDVVSVTSSWSAVSSVDPLNHHP